MQLPKQPNIHYDFRNPESVAKAINLKKCDNPEQLIKYKENSNGSKMLQLMATITTTNTEVHQHILRRIPTKITIPTR